MNKSGREKLNLFFSSFLVIGFVVCTYFFMTLTTATNMTTAKEGFVKAVVFVLFGLIIFYATRVGEGVAVKRFSPIVLCVLDIPALYIILASLVTKLPLHTQLASVPEIMMVAAIALGYGIPYAFFSGFELKEETEVIKEEEKESDTEEEVVEGGIMEELTSLSDTIATDDEIEELEALDGADAQ